jgi:predicted metal-binding protein
MSVRSRAEQILKTSGYDDFRWLCGTQLPVRRWVRFKCRYGCPNYGRLGACPPSAPSLDESRELFLEYRHIALIRLSAAVENLEQDAAWLRHVSRQLLSLEKAIFLAGFSQALALFPGPCRLCDICTGERNSCRHPDEVRPSPEALGVDLFGAARRAGYDMRILTNQTEPMMRMAFMLVA